MKRLLTIALFVAFSAAAQENKPIFGFANPAKEHQLESQFDAQLNRDNLRDWMRRLSARPHHLSSAYDHDNAEFLASLFRSWGYDTNIEEFRVLFPTPKTRVVELVAPEHYTLKLVEPPVAGDATSGQSSEQLPVYNAYSIDGDVTGELVYVNYGVPADYEQLERNGVDVKGRIAIARYGGSWRGIKPKVAAEHGAIGCIIYSDPRDDGYYQGDVYPKGAYRSENGAQRGSVMDMPIHPGDPLTPGIGATKDAKRLTKEESGVLTKIPVLPISYGDALPLLRALGGPVAPPDWRGALPITYHLGPGPARVHMNLQFNWNLVPAYDVIARLTGSERPDEWVMHGNHHDAWVNGANDPISGLVAELEEARAVGQLVKAGWRPKRTMIYMAWDGEEEGLLGSTEWAETHAAELQQHGAVYINSDSNSRGFLEAGGSHTLERLMTQVARDVPDPERNVSVLERLRARELANTTEVEKRKELRDRELIRLDALGSGSDYTPFLQHLGIAAMNIGYGGEGGGGSYHSVYDSFDHYTRFGDPNFDYGIAQAKTTGRLMLRLANADVLPFEFTTFANTLSRYVDELTKLADTTRRDIEERNHLTHDHTLEIAADPTRPFVAPKIEPVAPYLNFAPLQNAIAHLKTAAANYERAAAAPAAQPASIDLQLMHAEQQLTRPEGLPRRPWFRHQIYAPGFYTGYGVKTLPGVREAIEEKQWTEASQQVEIVARVIDGYATYVENAAAAMH
ncbi:MAG TPA: transferrin receptor-like dimerization domain-containing protein [Thermoanaerobaculia bacterium]